MNRMAVIVLAVASCVTTLAQQGRGGAQFPGGTNPDGSLRPSAPVTRLFTQDAYTEYALLEPGSEQFRIKFLPEETRAGATELVNATRGGSEGSGIEVYDPRTGKPLKFTYEQQGNDPDSHAIRAQLPIPVPEGGVGRVLIYKTYKDPRTYMMNGDDIVWVRSLPGHDSSQERLTRSRAPCLLRMPVTTLRLRSARDNIIAKARRRRAT